MEIELLEGFVFIEDVNQFLDMLNTIGNQNNVHIQALNAQKIAGRPHIDHSIGKALKALKQNNNVARDPGVEIMRYASGKRQIGEAFSMGLCKGNMDILVIIMGDSSSRLKTAKDNLHSIITPGDVMELSDTKKKIIMDQFDITSDELEAAGPHRLQDLVIERVSLVDILK